MNSESRRGRQARITDPDTRQRLLAAAEALSSRVPLSQIDAAKIAREAGVSWPTARRHLGSREQLQELLRKLNPAAAREDSTRERLLSAAARVFAERGYAGATLDEVSRAAALTKGAVYWHFQSKMELFLALMRARDARLETGGLDALPRHRTDEHPTHLLAGLLQQQFSNLLADETHLRLYLEFLAAARDPEPRQELARAYERQKKAIEAVVRELQRRGFLSSEAPVPAIAELLLLVFDGFVMMVQVAPETARGVRGGGSVADLLLRGLGAYLMPG